MIPNRWPFRARKNDISRVFIPGVVVPLPKAKICVNEILSVSTKNLKERIAYFWRYGRSVTNVCSTSKTDVKLVWV
jgi:hypothetical protein